MYSLADVYKTTITSELYIDLRVAMYQPTAIINLIEKIYWSFIAVMYIIVVLHHSNRSWTLLDII